MKLHIKRVIAGLAISLVALSSAFTSVQVTVHAAEYTKTEKKMSKSLAKFQSDLADSSSFYIVDIKKDDMEIDGKLLKKKVKSPYYHYEYAIRFKGTNAKGKTVYNWLFMTDDMDIWFPTNQSVYQAAVTTDEGDLGINAKSISADSIKNVRKLTTEYYKDL
ncbi:hypothetical protein SAMN05216391_1207 [Lachnospiraceae bacterium KHCPX20]|nr:hypothetical protein SAMN05216391_1207 [Lachnospiraceae bacterium KHCPX20]